MYANDGAGRWDGNVAGLVREAIESGKAGELVAAIAPGEDDIVLLKSGYSAFDATPLAAILAELGVDIVALAGTATEMCVFQTALDGRRAGFDVSVRADASATVDAKNEKIALDYLERVLGVEVARPSE